MSLPSISVQIVHVDEDPLGQPYPYIGEALWRQAITRADEAFIPLHAIKIRDRQR